MEVIFGKDFKLEAGDPYLFYAYEFRRYVFDARLIVAVGYGFGDPHINKMLAQGLHTRANIKLLVVCKFKNENVMQRPRKSGQYWM